MADSGGGDGVKSVSVSSSWRQHTSPEVTSFRVVVRHASAIRVAMSGGVHVVGRRRWRGGKDPVSPCTGSGL